MDVVRPRPEAGDAGRFDAWLANGATARMDALARIRTTVWSARADRSRPSRLRSCERSEFFTRLIEEELLRASRIGR